MEGGSNERQQTTRRDRIRITVTTDKNEPTSSPKITFSCEELTEGKEGCLICYPENCRREWKWQRLARVIDDTANSVSHFYPQG